MDALAGDAACRSQTFLLPSRGTRNATLRYSTHCATTPATALGSKPPSCVVENGTSQFLWCLNASDGLQPCARMNLRLRQHRRLRAEALDDRAHERTDRGRGDEHRRLALTRGVFEALAHQGDEFGEARGLHRQLTLVALTDDRFGEGLFPFGRQGDEREVAARRAVLRTDLAREPRADVLGERRRIAGVAEAVGDPFEDRREVADRDAFPQEILKDALDA